MLEQLGRVAAITSLMPVEAGVPTVVEVAPDPCQPGVVDVYMVVALYRRGLPLLQARAALDEMRSRGCTAVLLPTVECGLALASDLDAAGCLSVMAESGSGRDMLLRVRAAMDLPPDLPCVVETSGLPLQ